MAAGINLRAVALGHRLFHLLQALDPDPTAAPLLTGPIGTADGFVWPLKLSERAAERLADLLEAAEPQPQFSAGTALRLVHSSSEAAS